MGEFVNPRWLKVLAYTVAVVIASLNVWLLVQTFAGGSTDVPAHPGSARELRRTTTRILDHVRAARAALRVVARAHSRGRRLGRAQHPAARAARDRGDAARIAPT